MPLKLDNPEIVTLSKEEVKILSFSVDVGNNYLYIVYAEGHTDENGNFVRVGDIQQIDVPPQEFAELLSAYPDLYPTLKSVLYQKLIEKTGKTGQVV